MERTNFEVELERRFRWHNASPEQEKQMSRVRAEFLAFIQAMVKEFPEHNGRERSLFLTSMEEAMFWTNAGIVRPSI